MNTNEEILIFLAVIGWVLGFTVHILSIAQIDVEEKVPSIWFLHIGIFIVWIPAILEMRKNEVLKALQKSGKLNDLKLKEHIRVFFKDTPKWIGYLAIAGFFYAVLNFFGVMIFQKGTPDIIDGKYVLHIQGKIIKTLTDQEYHRFIALKVRGASGHWIAFYGYAAAILYPFKRNMNEINQHYK